MLTLLFAICMLCLFFKLIAIAVKAAWGLSKIVLFLIAGPILLVAMAVCGLVSLAFPILIVCGILALLCSGGRAR